MHWDLFCRIVDNYGDVGVCWRLARDLALRGERVRLWVDDQGILAWMAPVGEPGVELQRWHEADDTEPADVVIEAFGCDLPPAFVSKMAARATPPLWINLEYLSAEDFVERNHRLPSPQLAGPGRGLTKWFFYPGFSVRTGGLLREPGLAAHQQAFDVAGWRAAQGIPADGARVASLFCYDNPALPALLDALAAAPSRLLVCHGPVAQRVRAVMGSATTRGGLTLHYLPPLTQTQFDHLLWASDLNFVRGEDTFVRAQWAGRPFVWQTYPQHDNAHHAKLAAFQALYLADAPASLAAAVGTLWSQWNGRPAPADAGATTGPTAVTSAPALTLPPPALWAEWQRHGAAWRNHLLALPDLSSALRAFAADPR